MDVEEEHITIIRKLRLQLIGQLLHLVTRGSIVLTVRYVDDNRRIAVPRLMAREPVV